MWPFDQGNLRSVQALLDTGADAHAADHAWRTPLHAASLAGRTDVFDALAQHAGATVRAVDLQGRNVVHTTCIHGRGALLEWFLTTMTSRQDDNKDLLDARHHGKSLYHLACEHEHASVLEILFRYVGVPETELVDSSYGFTPLHTAVETNNVECVRYWLLHDPSVDVDFNQHNPSRQTPLHMACERGSLPMVQCLIVEGGATTSSRDIHGNTPLLVACGKGDLEVIQWMIQCWMVHYRQDAVDDTGATCLHVAAAEGHMPTVQWLVETAKVNVQAADHAGRTALHVAAVSSNGWSKTGAPTRI